MNTFDKFSSRLHVLVCNKHHDYANILEMISIDNTSDNKWISRVYAILISGN